MASLRLLGALVDAPSLLGRERLTGKHTAMAALTLSASRIWIRLLDRRAKLQTTDRFSLAFLLTPPAAKNGLKTCDRTLGSTLAFELAMETSMQALDGSSPLDDVVRLTM